MSSHHQKCIDSKSPTWPAKMSTCRPVCTVQRSACPRPPSVSGRGSTGSTVQVAWNVPCLHAHLVPCSVCLFWKTNLYIASLKHRGWNRRTHSNLTARPKSAMTHTKLDLTRMLLPSLKKTISWITKIMVIQPTFYISMCNCRFRFIWKVVFLFKYFTLLNDKQHNISNGARNLWILLLTVGAKQRIVQIINASRRRFGQMNALVNGDGGFGQKLVQRATLAVVRHQNGADGIVERLYVGNDVAWRKTSSIKPFRVLVT